VKPWQTKTTAATVEAPARASTLDDRLRALNAILRAGRSFFAEAGRRGARACQFQVSDATDESWYVVVDEHGGRAARGRHGAPSVTWASDREALDAAFHGKLLPGRVRIDGDYDVLRGVLRAIAQAPIR
jgi:hypothetical protein